jgi:ABC-type multidrug transport system permease subunit
MRTLVVTAKDLRRIWSDRKAFAINLALPLLLTFIMGLSFGGGIFGDSQFSAIPLAVVGEGIPAGFRDQLTGGLEDSGFFTVSWLDSLAPHDSVRKGENAAALVLPEDAFELFFKGDPLVVRLWKDPNSSLKAGIVEQILARSLARLQAGEAAYRALWPEDETTALQGPGGMTWEQLLEGDVVDVWNRWRDLGADPSLATAAEDLLQRVDREFALVEALQTETVVLDVQGNAGPADAGSGDETNLFDYFLPGFAVFFLMFGVSAGIRDVHRERVNGTLQRQLLAPLSAGQLLAGKWLAAVAQGILQLLSLFLVGSLLFGVNLGPDALSLVAVVVAAAAAAASLFMLLALLSPTEKIMDNLSTTVILVSALIGGNMIPLEAMPSWADTFGRWVFNYWANKGFQGVIADNTSILAQPGPVLMLAGAAVLFAGLSTLVLGIRQRRGGLA